MDLFDVLCIVSDDSNLIKEKILDLSRNYKSLKYYTHLYCYSPDPNSINFSELEGLIPKISISRSCNSRSLDSILIWSESCHVDLIILSNNERFLKEVNDRYGYKRHNIDVLN